MFDIRDWFAADELAACPCCRRKTALATPSGGFHICLECGLVRPNGERVTDLHAPLSHGRDRAA